MKKTFLILCSVLFCSSLLHGAQLLTKRDVNRDAKLIHHAAVYGLDSTQSQEFGMHFNATTAARDLDLTLFNDASERPDLLFIFDDYQQGIQKAKANHATPILVQTKGSTFPDGAEYDNITIIKASNIKSAARKAVAQMNDLFYVGMRPRYSTIFTEGEGGYVSYRIPSVLTLPTGRILAFIEARNAPNSDCAENDIVAKYSDDKGLTWSEIIVVAESGSASLNNPTAVYVTESDQVLIMFMEYPVATNEGISKTGFEGDDITRVFVSRSSDGGVTWDAKEDITRQAKLPDVASQSCGPGVGIQVASGPNKGRILIPHNAVAGKDGWFNYLVYSDDLGKSWGIIEGRSQYGTNESQVVQISDTEFLINARCHRYVGDETSAPEGWNPWNFSKVTRYRGEVPVSIKGTEGEWEPTSIRYDMPDPLCQGSIIRYSGLQSDEPSVLLFTNPASNLTDSKGRLTGPPIRINGSIAWSGNDGQTWSVRKRFYGNRYTEYQYSVPTNVGEGLIGVIFEASSEIKFALFDMDWLTSGADLD